MCIRRVGLGLLAALLVTWTGGCKKAPSTEPPEAKPSQAAQPKPSAPPVETVARVHWLGKKRLGSETNAAGFMAIWNLPESARLEAQTLDKLAMAPWLLRDASPATNRPPCLTNYPSAALLRPLLDDLVQEESYLEIQNATNLPGELALAIRLTPQRAALWETNLAAALESLTGARSIPTQGTNGGWQLQITNQLSALHSLQLTRSGDWTILGLASDKNGLAVDLSARIQKDQAPCPTPATNYWIEASLDLPRVASALACGWKLAEDLPKASVAVIGDGENVRTRGELNFPKPLPIGLESWCIPTNLLREPLVSFTALRGISPWVSSFKAWKELQCAGAPNQLFCWAQGGVPFQTYAAVSLPNTTNFLNQIGENLLQEVNPWIASNFVGRLERASNSNGVVWVGLPFVVPFLKSSIANGGEFAVGGLIQNISAGTNRSVPAELFHEVVGRTNLLLYDWELSGPRVESWIRISQLVRLLAHKAQLPAQSASLAWLDTAKAKFGNSVTVVTRTGQDQLSFVRKSSVGLTAIELHLLADWLESPQFPFGCHTMLAPPPAVPLFRPRSNFPVAHPN